MSQETCAKCARGWEFNDVAVQDSVDGPWRHHDCNDPKLEVTVSA